MKIRNNKSKYYPNVLKVLEVNIYSRRKELGMSQQELSQRIGVSRNCIQQMECYEHMPLTSTILDLLLELGYTLDGRTEFWKAYMDAYYQDKARFKEQE